ncbi:MAG: hypothetical protein K2Z81_12170 [Cyanobacteria bacterium]|nr:hypothetical protein [Cyanobacteriota bacterium]
MKDRKNDSQPIGDPFASEESWLSDISPKDESHKGDKTPGERKMEPRSSKSRSRLFRVLAAIGVSAAICAMPIFFQAEKQSRPTAPVFNALNSNAIPDELELKKTDDGRYIFVVNSRRTGKGDSSVLQSQITVYDTKTKGAPRLIWQSATEELYGVHITFPCDWTYHGEQVALVTRQAGAAAEVADVIRLDDGKVSPVERWQADRFELANLDSRPDSVLILHERLLSMVDVPRVFTWYGSENNSLVDCSKKMPKYFAKLLQEFDREHAAEPQLGTNAEYGRALMLSLADRKGEAVQLLKRLLPQARNEEDPDLLRNIEGTLNDLMNYMNVARRSHSVTLLNP